MRAILVGVGLLAAMALGCGGDDTATTGDPPVTTAPAALCVPGQQAACGCLGLGLVGVQVCEDSGERMGSCACPAPVSPTTAAAGSTASSAASSGATTGAGGATSASSSSSSSSSSAATGGAGGAGGEGSTSTGAACVPVTSQAACAALGPVAGIVGLAGDGCGGTYACGCPAMPDVSDGACDAPSQMLYCGAQTGKLSNCTLVVYSSVYGWEYCCSAP
jgi:hypothetical protein